MLTEAEEALARIVKIVEDPDINDEFKLVHIERAARTYFLDQLSRESHEFEP